MKYTKEEYENAKKIISECEAPLELSEISSKPKKHYSVINNKTGQMDEYTYLAWNIAWLLVFFHWSFNWVINLNRNV